MKKRKHGLHQPDSCCILCYWLSSPSELPEGFYESMDDTPKPYVGHAMPGYAAADNLNGKPDPGVRRTYAARVRTSDAAGDRWES